MDGTWEKPVVEESEASIPDVAATTDALKNVAIGQTKKAEYLVVDAGALIRQEDLRPLANKFYTCPEILMEIRDAKARKWIDRLPFQLELCEPTDESMRQVVEFCKATGDFAALSKPDIKIIALTRSLEVEHHGMENIRLEPLRFGQENQEPDAEEAAKQLAKRQEEEERQRQMRKEIVKSSVLKQGVSWATALAGKSTQSPSEQVETKPTIAAAAAAAVPSPTQEAKAHEESTPTTELSADCWDDDDFAIKETSGTQNVPEQAQQPEESAEEQFPPLPAPEVPGGDPLTVEERRALNGVEPLKPLVKKEKESQTSEDASELPTGLVWGSKSQFPSAPKTESGSRIIGLNAGNFTAPLAAEEDDGEGWASIDTINQLGQEAGWRGGVPKPRQAEKPLEPSNSSVACVTTDYAMQNVMLQMRLRLITLEGRAVTQIKHWVLKCDGCFYICKDISKKFCPRCGNHTLARLSYSIDENGQLRYYYKKNRRVNIRGSKYSIPLPKGGRQGDLLLREDQLMMGSWAQKYRQKDKNTSMFGEDVTDSLGLSLSTRGKQVTVGYGRRNRNSMKGRERRGKKASNK